MSANVQRYRSWCTNFSLSVKKSHCSHTADTIIILAFTPKELWTHPLLVASLSFIRFTIISHLYHGCFLAEISNQEMRNSRRRSRSFWKQAAENIKDHHRRHNHFPPGNGILTSSSQRASCWRNSLLASSASLSPLRRRNLTLRKKLRSHQPAKSLMFRRDMFFLLASRLVEKAVVVVGDSITPTHLQPLPYFWNHKRDFFSPGSSAGDRLGCKYIGRGQEGWRGRCGQGGTPPGWLCHLSLDMGWVITYLLSFWMHDMLFCEHQNVQKNDFLLTGWKYAHNGAIVHTW